MPDEEKKVIYNCPLKFNGLVVIGDVDGIGIPFTCRGCDQGCTLQKDTVESRTSWDELTVIVYLGGFRDIQYRTTPTSEPVVSTQTKPRQVGVLPRGPFPGDYPPR